MTTHYFDTGVGYPGSHTNPPLALYGRQVVRGGSVQIPFECEVPSNAIFKFASNDPEADKSGKLYRTEIADREVPGGLTSRYAFFLIPRN